MIALMLALLCGTAQAGEVRVVERDDTIDQIAEQTGFSAEEIRALNNMAAGEEPEAGTLLQLPAGEVTAQLAVVWALNGEATAKLPDGGTETLAQGRCLPLGARVCTGDESFVAVRLQSVDDEGAHDDLSLLPGTCVTVHATSTLAGGRNAFVSVDSGSVAVRTEGEGEGRLAVQTRDGVVLGGGGDFRVTQEEEATRTESLTDRLKVFGQGVQVDVGPAQGNRVKKGEAPQDPVDLLLPGSPIRPEEGAALRWTDFGWVPVTDAIAYRIEVARDPSFTDLVHAEAVKQDTWTPELLVLPVRVDALWWRITAYDSLGFLGMPSDSRSVTVPVGAGQ